MKKILIVAAGLVAFAAPALAADLAPSPVYTKAPVVVATVYDWTGWYVGGNVGYGWGGNTDPALSYVNPGNDGNITTFLTTGVGGVGSGNQFPNLKPSGVFGGGQFGYDKQYGTWVVGVVADIQAANFTDSALVLTSVAATGANTNESLSAKIDWFGTVRGKVGVAAHDWLFYGTGGLAYGDTKSSIGFACTPGGVLCGSVNFAGNTSETRVGWAGGAGIAKAWGNWNVGLEYLHIDLGRSSVTGLNVPPIGVFPTTTITEGQRFTEDMVRVTVNYKWGSTVVAKY